MFALIINYSFKKGDTVAGRVSGKDIVGKIVISEESGRKFGIVGDVNFITESGELMNLVLEEPTKVAQENNLSQDDDGRLLIPFSAVKAVGEFVVISEKEVS